MACCDKCENFNDSHILSSDIEVFEDDPNYQPDLYYYWQYPLEEDYQMPDGFECLCEICFDILNQEGKIKWKEETV
tara:strand:+ start:476 stop:703 length:228 start_codon:yes stop_codon:yes gene_type:complete